MRTASFLVKPASARCNLACRYCFYREVAGRRAEADRGCMRFDTMGLLLDRAFELGAEAYSFGFQGGEPTLAGLDFFREFGEQVRTRNASGARIELSLQTNGLLVDARWARLLKDEGYLVGLSLDGPRLVHDARRVGSGGSGSYDRALAGLEALKAEGVPVNALCVVDAVAADNAESVYRHLRRKGFDWIQFIPLIEPPGDEDGRGCRLEPGDLARFLSTVFELWLEELREGREVHVRWFDDLAALAAEKAPSQCGMAGRCGSYFTVEADGSVYPCDFYVTDEWRLGGLADGPLRDLANGPAARRFLELSEPVHPACAGCFAYPLCRGGCRRDREVRFGSPLGPNRHCPEYKEFFARAGERILALGKAIRTGSPRKEDDPWR